MKSHYKQTLFAVIGFLVCLAGVWSYLVKRAEWDARGLFRESLQLQVGNARAADVLDLVTNAPGEKYGFEPCLAGHVDCIGTIYVANTWLDRFYLARSSTFGARFVVTNNRLTNREFLMESHNVFHSEASSFVFINEGMGGPGWPAFKAYRESNGVGVNMTTEAAEDMRKAAYDFNFGCLVKIGGCQTDGEMLPIVNRKDFIAPQDSARTYR
jgi:hypothetical protein